MGDLIGTSMGVATRRHACWGYGDEDGFWRDAETFLREGIEQGEQVMRVARPGRTAAPEPDAGPPGLWATLSTDDFYAHPPGNWAANTERMVEEALRQGFPGVRLVTDATEPVARSQRHTVLEWELELDRLTSGYPFQAICGIQPSSTDKDKVADMAAVHPRLRGGMPAPLASIHVAGDTVYLAGEFDLTTRHLLEVALNRPENDLDLSDVWFMDLDSIAMLRESTRTAERSGRPIHLRGVPSIVARCWSLMGP